ELGLERVGVQRAELLVGQMVGQAERVVADTDGSQALGISLDDDDLGMRLTAQVPQVHRYVLRGAGRCHFLSPSVGWGELRFSGFVIAVGATDPVVGVA